MNNKGSSSEQFFRFLFLALGAMILFNYYFQRPKPTDVAPRNAPALVEAFKGVDPAQGPIFTKTQALAENKKLQAEIKKNGTDPKSYWARLRVALLRQYILDDLDTKTRKSGFLGLGPTVSYYPAYDEVIHAGKGDAIEAQAHYQVGDLEWRKSTRNGGEPSREANIELEALLHKGRGNSTFLGYEIWVPKEADPAKVPLVGPPPGGFRAVKVGDLRNAPNGIPDRVNKFYEGSTFYKIFDTVVKAFGENPTYSYGLAILAFAIFTRVVLQPIYKRQYDSMKGLAAIAPEMKAIQEKYKGKTDQTSQMAMIKETQALQRMHGVNPMLGCGLALLQMPIFFLFVYPMIQHYEPKMELVGASFLWMPSLARPDVALLILYGISMFFSFRLSATPPTDDMQRQQQMLMSYVFPIIFPLFILTYPAAFTMYWMTYNVVSTAFQWRMIKAATPEKTLWGQISGADLKPQNPTADAVPERPKSAKKTGSGKVETLNPAAQNGAGKAEKSSNGGSNGKARGKVQSAPEGAVLEPLNEEPLQNGSANGSNNGSANGAGPKKSRKK